MGNCNRAASSALLEYKQNLTIRLKCESSIKKVNFSLANPAIDKKEIFQIPRFNLKFSICITPEQDVLRSSFDSLKVQHLVLGKPDCVLAGLIEASGPCGHETASHCKSFIKDYFLINEILDYKDFLSNIFISCEESLDHYEIDRTASGLSLTLLLLIKDGIYSVNFGTSKATLSAVPNICPDFHTFEASHKTFCPSRMLNVTEIASSQPLKDTTRPAESISSPIVSFHQVLEFRDLFLVVANSSFWKLISTDEASCFVEYFRGLTERGKDALISEKNSSISRLALEEARSRNADLLMEKKIAFEELGIIVIEIISRDLWKERTNVEESDCSSYVSSGIYVDPLRNTKQNFEEKDLNTTVN